LLLLKRKLFHYEILKSSNSEQNLIENSEILRSLKHPNILKYKERFENEKNNTVVFITEYCNVSLNQFFYISKI
jgi:serine/threonine protein kinase